MVRVSRSSVAIAAFALLVLLLAYLSKAGVLRTEIAINYVGTETGERVRYTFDVFTGDESALLPCESGEELVLEYEVFLLEGTLSMELVDPTGNVLWFKEFKGNESGDVKVFPEGNGFCSLRVKGNGARGGYEVTWS